MSEPIPPYSRRAAKFTSIFARLLEDKIFESSRSAITRRLGLLYVLPGLPSQFVKEVFNRTLESDQGGSHFPDYASDFGRNIYAHHDFHASGALSLSKALDVRSSGNHLIYVARNLAEVPRVILENAEAVLDPRYDAFALSVAAFRMFVEKADKEMLSDLDGSCISFRSGDDVPVGSVDDIFVRCEGVVAPGGKWKPVERSEQFTAELYFMFRDFAFEGRVGARDVARCMFWEKPRSVAATVVSTDGSVPTLAEFPGLGDLRTRLGDLLRRYSSSNPPRSGILLHGPTGTGKTMLARTIARETGRNLVATSVGSWQSGSHLGTFLGAMSEDFKRAREMAPSMIFLDELDSLPNRTSRAGHDFYESAATNRFLELIDGFSGRGDVLLVGATNNKDKIDSAVLRPGRFGEHVHVPNPSVEGIREIVQWSVDRAECDHGVSIDVDPASLSRLMAGLSPAQIRSVVDAAVSFSNDRAEPLDVTHFEQALTAAARNIGFDRQSSDSTANVWATAVHEAGHALCAHLFMAGSIDFVQLANGVVTQGAVFVSDRWSEAGGMRADLAVGVMSMCGRAAEYVVLGAEAMGYGASSDIRKARDVGMNLARNGMSPAGFAEFVDPEDEALKADAASRWLSLFNVVALKVMHERKAEVEALARMFVERPVMEGRQVHGALEAMGVPSGIRISDFVEL